MKYKKGDKLLCVQPSESDGLIEGRIYTVLEYNKFGNVILKDLEECGGWAEQRFDLHKSNEGDMESQILKAKNIIQGGKSIDWLWMGTVREMNNPTTIEVIFKGRHSSHSVDTWLMTHDYCVAIRNDAREIIPFGLVTEKKEVKVSNVGDYDAIIEKDSIKVGCQTIPWSKVEEIVKAHAYL